MTNIQAINLLKGLEQSLDEYCELNDEGKTAFHMAITALEVFGNSEQLPSAQPKKSTEERTETHACDCISRQAARETVTKHFRVDNDLLEVIAYEIEHLPSAQPQKSTEERTGTHACDYISRQAAIDAVNEWFRLYVINRTMSNVTGIQDVLRQLPSAQPEIIRCKDCEYYHPYYCEMWSKFGTIQTTEDGYCYKAERREE